MYKVAWTASVKDCVSALYARVLFKKEVALVLSDFFVQSESRHMAYVDNATTIEHSILCLSFVSDVRVMYYIELITQVWPCCMAGHSGSYTSQERCKGAWWMPRLLLAMKDAAYLRYASGR